MNGIVAQIIFLTNGYWLTSAEPKEYGVLYVC